MPPFEFWEFVTDHVRHAASSVITLASRTDGAMNSTEDDTTGLIREMLKSRLAFAGWNVADQSTGGSPKRGTPESVTFLSARTPPSSRLLKRWAAENHRPRSS